MEFSIHNTLYLPIVLLKSMDLTILLEVSADDVGIQVSSGNLLSVRFASSCTDNACLFQPAIVNESTNYNLTFYNDSLDPFVNISSIFSYYH